MARNKKPSKPKKKPMYKGMSGFAYKLLFPQKTPEEKQISTLTDYYAGIDAFLQGRAEFAHFEKLVYAVNVTRVLADMGFGAEYEQVIYDGMAAVQRIKDRHEKTRTWGIDGDGRKALYAMEDLHRAQLEIATQGEIAAAIQEMWRRINMGLKFKEKEAA